MSGLLSQAALLVATSQLTVTNLLIKAIRTADLASRPVKSPYAPIAPSRCDHPVHCDIVDLHCCRTECHPHCDCHHCCPPANPSPTIIYRPARPALGPYIPRAAELHQAHNVSPTESPIEPPWKVLPWENPPQPAQTVKIHPHHADVVQKGMLLDLFV